MTDLVKTNVLRKDRQVILPAGYADFLKDLKTRIKSAQLKAAASANRPLIELYWDIGQRIVERQKSAEWGKAIVERVARDLQTEFPGMAGFSPGNVWRMRAFYLAYANQTPILSQPVTELDGRQMPPPLANIPWGHNLELLFKLDDPTRRLWYARQTIENGWSRVDLVHQIEIGLYERQGKAPMNFNSTLPTSRELEVELGQESSPEKGKRK
ncbi:MAG: hypothetical protein KGL04_11210, partial [Elusimicrobia bacterium]|nr:hypothetical protein [Elusimicrobiota bacterium]